jgi:hypothetical protein
MRRKIGKRLNASSVMRLHDRSVCVKEQWRVKVVSDTQFARIHKYHRTCLPLPQKTYRSDCSRAVSPVTNRSLRPMSNTDDSSKSKSPNGRLNLWRNISSAMTGNKAQPDSRTHHLPTISRSYSCASSSTIDLLGALPMDMLEFYHEIVRSSPYKVHNITHNRWAEKFPAI